MLVTLTRLDKLAAAKREFTVRGMMIGTTSSYTAMVLAGYQPQMAAVQAAADLAAAEDDDDDDDGVVHGPRSLSDIELSPTAQRGYPKYLADLAAHIHQPTLPLLLRRFLHAEVHGPPRTVLYFPRSMRAPLSEAASAYTTPPLHASTPPAISAVPGGCIARVFDPTPNGTDMLGATPCSLM
ncbi:hypothetical protein B0H19DRAFT_444798 [Mycena capillaripes]|nr:hypothetical protein B0H19DRAFT_444798 [Mycena capillaripes]